MTVGDGCCRTTDRVAPGGRHRQRVVGRRGDGLGVRERAVEFRPPLDECGVDGHPDRVDELGRHGARTGDRDLLADDRPHECLERIDAARRPTTRNRTHERTEYGIVAEVRVDGDGIGIQVEHAADTLDGRRQVGPIVDAQARDDVVGVRRDGERHDAMPVREGQDPPVGGHTVDELRTSRRRESPDDRGSRGPPHRRTVAESAAAG